MTKIKFNNKNPEFFNELRSRVESYFETKKIKQTGNYKLYAKTAILFSVLVGSYITLVFFTPSSVFVCIMLCIVLGINFAAIGFNVMHDGAHGSYSSKKWINEAMSYSLNVLGGSSYMWKLKHNINHHSYTNIEGLDDDIDIKPFIRVHESQDGKWFHKFQHIYGILLYGLTYLFWVFFNDFKKYFSSKIADYTPLRKMDLKEHFIFWITKVTYVGTFIVLPIFFTSVLYTVIGYLIVVFVCGLVIAIVFQLAHIIEDMDFIDTDGNSQKIETEWAIHQINTTANFATKSKSMTWFMGGLNFQIEHHLFPKISHIHYPQIQKIVKQVCEEFNITYKEFPTVLSAVRSHLLHLKAMGSAA